MCWPGPSMHGSKFSLWGSNSMPGWAMTGLPRSFHEGTERTELCRGCMEVSLPVSPSISGVWGWPQVGSSWPTFCQAGCLNQQKSLKASNQRHHLSKSALLMMHDLWTLQDFCWVWTSCNERSSQLPVNIRKTSCSQHAFRSRIPVPLCTRSWLSV